jgi:hypothetical protein
MNKLKTNILIKAFFIYLITILLSILYLNNIVSINNNTCKTIGTREKLKLSAEIEEINKKTIKNLDLYSILLIFIYKIYQQIFHFYLPV